VDANQDRLPARHRVHLNTTVKRISQLDNGMSLTFDDGSCEDYDHIVLAMHANQAIKLLDGEATDAQRKILGAFKTSRNVCYLHSDEPVSVRRSVAYYVVNNGQVTAKAPMRPCSLELSSLRISMRS
jgi:predicted NAD/FAD-binding protein